MNRRLCTLSKPEPIVQGRGRGEERMRGIRGREGLNRSLLYRVGGEERMRWIRGREGWFVLLS